MNGMRVTYEDFHLCVLVSVLYTLSHAISILGLWVQLCATPPFYIQRSMFAYT